MLTRPPAPPPHPQVLNSLLPAPVTGVLAESYNIAFRVCVGVGGWVVCLWRGGRAGGGEAAGAALQQLRIALHASARIRARVPPTFEPRSPAPPLPTVLQNTRASQISLQAEQGGADVASADAPARFRFVASCNGA